MSAPSAAVEGTDRGDVVDDALDGWDDVDEPTTTENPGAGPDVGEGGAVAQEVLEAFEWLAAAEEAATVATRRLAAAQDALADAQGVVRVAEARRDDLEEDVAPWQHAEAGEALAQAERRRRRAGAEVARREEDLESLLDRAAAARDQLDAVREAAAAREESGDAGESEEPSLYFGSVDEFVREVIVPTFRRRVGERGSFRWAADWWRHPEAVVRLEALWRAWEFLRLDPATGMSVWLRDHADHHLGVLFADYGPFGRSEDSSQLGEPLPYVAPPAGLFPDVREEATASDG